MSLDKLETCKQNLVKTEMWILDLKVVSITSQTFINVVLLQIICILLETKGGEII